jgi:hypothetical protein
MDTAKYFQNGLTELVEIRQTVRSVEILSFGIFFNFLTSFILKITCFFLNGTGGQI